MPIRLVIFDCDGVLVDSEPIATQVEAELLTELGWPLSPSEVAERFLGRSDADMIAEIERHLGRPVPDFKDRYQRRLHSEFRARLQPVRGLIPALDRLDTATCVASSGTHDKMRLTLGLTGLWSRFEGRIYSASEVERGKPAPDLFLHAAKGCGVAPSDCVVVEDSPSGVEAGRAAGMRVLAYGGGVTPPARLEGRGGIVFDDMADLPALVESLDR